MEQLIELWQQATIDESSMDRSYHKEEVAPQIIKLERKQQKLLSQKIMGAIIALVALLVVFVNRWSFSVYSVVGIGIFTLSVILILLLLNRLRFKITNEERSLPTLQLADVAVRKIKSEQKIFTLYLPLFALVALIGFNLMNLDFFSEEDSATRLLYHGMLTGIIAVSFVIGLFVRIRRFRKQFLPLLDLIRKFKMESE